MYYGGGRSREFCVLVLGVTLVIWGALEAALVSALRVREPPQFFFHVLSVAAGNQYDRTYYISLRIDVAHPPARLAYASSGS